MKDNLRELESACSGVSRDSMVTYGVIGVMVGLVSF
jgi:hypothetical protein